MRLFALSALLAAGCGRINFDVQELEARDGGAAIDSATVLTDASFDAVPGDGAVVDATPPVDAILLVDATPSIDASPSVDAAVDAAALLKSITGSYVTDVAVQYTCAGGLLTIDFDTLTFDDMAASLTVTSDDLGAPVQPCVMSGNPVANGDTFDVTCSLLGGCDEIYRLTGTFSDRDNWAGTFTADFVGACFGCMDQSIALNGSR